MSREALSAVVSTVQDYVRYLQRLGMTEFPMGRVAAAAVPPVAGLLPAVADGQPPVTTAEVPAALRLQQLAERFHDCRQCRLHQGRKQVVFGTGDPQAALVFVGEAPGEEEDRQGEPFVGAAGQLLNRIIEAIGLRRNQVYLLNVVKCRPPGNRNPLPDELAACRPILEAELACLKPQVVCALGNFAAQALLQTEERISRLRGRFHTLGDIQVMPTYHPAYILRNPQSKRAVWDDMQHIQRALGLR